MRIGHFPQHISPNPGRSLRSTKALGVLSGGFTEMDGGRNSRQIPEARKVYGSGYDVFTDADSSLGVHSQEVPIVFHRRNLWWTSTHHEVFKLSGQVGTAGIGNDRYLTEAHYGLRVGSRKVWHLASHLMAGIQASDGSMEDNDRVAAMELAVPLIETRIALAKAVSAQCALTIDWNWRTGPHVPAWHYSPLAVARRHGLKTFNEGIDWILYSPGLVLRHPVTVYPAHTGINPEDHPWFVADFRVSR